MNSKLVVDHAVIQIPKSEIRIGADFEVAATDRLAIQAPSGFGKTTLFRAIAGFFPLARGRIELDPGWSKLPVHQRQVGFLFQEPGLFPHLNVFENLAYALKLQAIGKAERHSRVEKALDRIQMRGQSRLSIENLSGGEKQRIALARLFMVKPKVILLDEPFAALDQKLQIEMANWVLELHQESPVPLLWITHQNQGLDVLANRKIEGRIDEKTHDRIFASSH